MGNSSRARTQKFTSLTHGLHYGERRVSRGERAYGGVIFKSREHSERLKHSATIMDFEIPYSVAEIEAAKRLVVEKNGQPDAYVRPDRVARLRAARRVGPEQHHPPRHRGPWEWPSYFDPAQRLKGIRLDLAEYPPTRPADPRRVSPRLQGSI